MRRAKKESGASLDSLLDTMTNVVGILVILLTVTQLGVGDAVRRLAESDSVKPEVLEEARRQLLELQRERIKLARRLDALDSAADLDVANELRKILAQIDSEENNLANLREGREKEETKLLEAQRLRDEAQRLLDEQKKEAEELLAMVNANEDELAKLKAQLEKATSDFRPTDTVINLPNPRAAPEGTTPIIVICREGRVMFADVDLIREKAQRRAMSIVTRRKLNRDPAAGIDPKALIDEFNKEPIEDRYFQVKLAAAGRIPKLVFERIPDGAETTEELIESNSQFQRRIKRTDIRKHYIRFLVWPDSFETYLEARKICSKRNLLAGWQAQTSSAEYTINLEGPILLGPPPPPKPKPQPKPPEPDDDKPKPPPKPKPRPRPAPVDVID